MVTDKGYDAPGAGAEVVGRNSGLESGAAQPGYVDERGTLGALPDGVRVRHEFSTGEPNIGRYYVHPDDVPTDPDAELIERVALGLSDNVQEYHRTVARGIIALVRDHDKADR